KIPQSISHYSSLLNTNEKVLAFTDAVSFFEEKLGMLFLQMHENFNPKDFDRLKNFVEDFPKGFPLAVKVRNEEWLSNTTVLIQYCSILQRNTASNIILDSASSPEMLHMC